MEIDKSRYKFAPKPSAYSAEQDLANQIYVWSKKRLNYPMLRSYLKKRGFQAIYDMWNEVKQSEDARDPVALFMWKLRKPVSPPPLVKPE